MSRIVTHDLNDAHELDCRSMGEACGGWFGGASDVTSSTSNEPAKSQSLYDVCCTGKHLPTATLGVYTSVGRTHKHT